MKLGQWLTEKKITQAEFAVRITVDESSVSRYCDGRMPRREILARIMAETDNQVTANDFVPPVEVAEGINATCRTGPAAPRAA